MGGSGGLADFQDDSVTSRIIPFYRHGLCGVVSVNLLKIVRNESMTVVESP